MKLKNFTACLRPTATFVHYNLCIVPYHWTLLCFIFLCFTKIFTFSEVFVALLPTLETLI